MAPDLLLPLATFQSPGPMLFEFGPLAIRWYGLLIALAVLLGLWISSELAKSRGLDGGLIADLKGMWRESEARHRFRYWSL